MANYENLKDIILNDYYTFYHRELYKIKDPEIVEKYIIPYIANLEDFKKEEIWRYISKNVFLNNERIRKYKNDIYWYLIIKNRKFDENDLEELEDIIKWKEFTPVITDLKLLKKYGDKIDWRFIDYTKVDLDLETIEKYKDKLRWNYLSWYYKNINFEFIEKYKDYISWSNLSINENLSREIIIKYKDKLNHYNLSKCNRNLTEEDYENILDKDKLDWYSIPRIHPDLSLEFVKRNEKYFNWYTMGIFHNLDEDFVKEFNKKLNWWLICCNRELTFNDIINCYEYIEWKALKFNNQLDDKILREFQDKIDIKNCDKKRYVKIKKEFGYVNCRGYVI